MDKYVDYNFYTKVFGGKLSTEDFSLYEIKARKFIDKITFNRINSDNLNDDIKFCVCIIAEKIKDIEDNGGIKTSETVGKHSVSFLVSQNLCAENILYKEATKYLSTNLLYRGME